MANHVIQWETLGKLSSLINCEADRGTNELVVKKRGWKAKIEKQNASNVSAMICCICTVLYYQKKKKGVCKNWLIFKPKKNENREGQKLRTSHGLKSLLLWALNRKIRVIKASRKNFL